MFINSLLYLVFQLVAKESKAKENNAGIRYLFVLFLEKRYMSQVIHFKGLDRRDLVDRPQNHNDDSRLPLVLTYHPAFFKVHEILQYCSNRFLCLFHLPPRLFIERESIN